MPAERVSTSKPDAVTSTVCSHWAESEWSLVTIVQPSDSSLISRRPALIIGSIVKIMPAVSLTMNLDDEIDALLPAV